MNSLFITSNAFFLEGKSGGFLISRRNRDLLRKITNENAILFLLVAIRIIFP